ncbi:MAG TPA: hypothetical protein VIT23_16485, partial [Terrimicrobiaceae bacterium]
MTLKEKRYGVSYYQNEFGRSLIVKHPRLGSATVSPHTEALLILRDDTEFAVQPVARRLCKEYTHLDYQEVLTVLREEYGQKMLYRLLQNYHSALVDKALEVHLFDPATLRERLKMLLEGCYVISMDPLVKGHPAPLSLRMSRIHENNTSIGHGSGNRSLPLTQQIEEIKTCLAAVSGRENGRRLRVACLDDDCFSGETMHSAKERFAECGLSVEVFAAGIKVGRGEEFASNFTVLGAVDYSPLRDAIDIDVIDLRDFVVGYDGMGVFLPRQQQLGRVPCLLPFFAPSGDTLVCQGADEQFSLNMWKANKVHFST